MKNHRFLVLILCLALLLTACGGSAPTDEGYNSSADKFYDAGMEMPAETAPAGELTTGSSTLSPAVQTERKLIKTVHMESETENYDELIPSLDARITALGGYVEARETGNYSKNRRWTRMTIRIPAEQLAAFTSHVTENANVLSTSEQTQDVTLQYADTEAKITALKTEQTRLLELLAQAQNLSEILEIEARLSDVTYELERYESQKRSYDNRIVYATVTLSIQEVAKLTPVEEPTVWQRISRGFRDSLEGVSNGFVNLFVFLIAESPRLVVWGAVIAAVIVFLRRRRRKAPESRQTPPPENT